MSGGIGVFGDQIPRDGIGLVIALALFVLHHAALQVQGFLVNRVIKMPHAVGFHEQRIIQRGCGHILEIVRAVGIGRAVEVRRAHALHRLDVAPLEVFAAAEHQVFEQVCKPGLPRLFVLRAHVIPDVQSYDWRLVIFVYDHGQPVRKHKFLIGDLDVLPCRACRGHRQQRHRREQNKDLGDSIRLQTHCSSVFSNLSSLHFSRKSSPPKMPCRARLAFTPALVGKAAALLVCEMASQKDKRRNTPLLLDARHTRKFQQQDRVADQDSQYTARFWMVSFVANENRASAAVPSSSWPATYSPIAGPCLNPCPEPPPANHTFSISGCRSIKKSPFDVFSYWQTRVSTIGASFSAGNRHATYCRISSIALAETVRDCVSGSILSP